MAPIPWTKGCSRFVVVQEAWDGMQNISRKHDSVIKLGAAAEQGAAGGTDSKELVILD